jgi:hypothetical protein
MLFSLLELSAQKPMNEMEKVSLAKTKAINI